MPRRGYLLELLLTKLRYATLDCDPWARAEVAGEGAAPGGAQPLMMRSEGLQIIGMSATMPNVDQVGLADWCVGYQAEGHLHLLVQC